ncbi:MAG TPA: TIGR03885 family FMN-dependent LLM class oxidoreductase [Tepidisphaeraceae bacterium]|jgi:probable non-F420 flavinoid oxidoreductase|nr:TIGR03885 family FMN-dependent LLM class oxidoreductase [Tepidisphaeraceae bacterium]
MTAQRPRSIGFHASHEQFPPDRLLRLVQQAERAGFDSAMCSDHFAPFGESQGQSGFAWSWLGAAMATTSLPFGVVNAPGQRYHPAIIAQAAATIEVMFPGRFWIAVGSGQLINEHITGDRWPTKHERNDRLRESVEVIRQLWSGQTVTHRGHVTVSEAQLWTRPARPPELVGAAVTPTTAAWVATWADALITVVQPDEQLDKVVAAFRDNGGAGKPMYLQAHVAYAPTDAEARGAAFDEWRTNALPSSVTTDLRHPAQLAAAAEHVRPEDMDKSVRISSDLDRHAEWIRNDFARGFDAIYLHEVGPEQERFIETFGREVLRRVR